ncbi:NEDD4-binding protein 2-like 1 isoform X1 [Acipenser oxyrinchus oxyrinchus]|uniref:NEDD4-binding protein 2-like 1 isoform X1 n=1 Tax=Acipenser oxyrinchus oxyrinchus TaxID=40147 RepID=A0AAD8G4Z9_ACIOX|nr:NEDD4-binding protein 2-like 1 isoform X1 [Acipenser oxyrinchus oxyrinchus]
MGDDFVQAFSNMNLQQNRRRRRRRGRRRERPNKLFILRGLPGSGKSHLAREIKNQFGSAEILSTDDYFRNEDGDYIFQGYLLKQAHEWNRNRARSAMEEGLSPVIIDNTNIHAWEMKPYVNMALEYDYEVIFREPETSWKWNVNKLHRKTRNGVPYKTIERMLDDFEEVSNIHDVLNSEMPRRYYPGEDYWR